MLPPAVLLEDCLVNTFAGATYGDLVQHAIDLKESLELCNNDKAALRKWSEEQ